MRSSSVRLLLNLIIVFTAQPSFATGPDLAHNLKEVMTVFDISLEEILIAEKDSGEVFQSKNLVNYDLFISSALSADTFIKTDCSLTEAKFQSLENLSHQKAQKVFLKFIKKNTKKKIFSKETFSLLPVPKTVSIQSINCFTDASKYVLGMVYQDPEGPFYRIDVSLDGFN